MRGDSHPPEVQPPVPEKRPQTGVPGEHPGTLSRDMGWGDRGGGGAPVDSPEGAQAVPISDAMTLGRLYCFSP